MLFNVSVRGWLIVLVFSLFLYVFCFNVLAVVFLSACCVCRCCFRLVLVVCCLIACLLRGVTRWFWVGGFVDWFGLVGMFA